MRLRLRSPIAQARQAGEGFGARAQSHAQAGDLGQAAGDQGRPGIEAQCQPIAKPSGNGQHIFDRTADFGANQVIVGVNPQGRAVKGLDQRSPHRFMVAGRHQRGRPAQGDLAGKAGAAEYATHQLRRDLGLNLVDHQAALLRARLRQLKAFGKPGHGNRQMGQLTEKAACGRHWARQYHQVLLGRCGLHIATDEAQGRWQLHPGQISRVAALSLQGLQLLRIARPQADPMPILGRRVGGQGGAPGTGADDSDFHGGAEIALP